LTADASLPIAAYLLEILHTRRLIEEQMELTNKGNELCLYFVFVHSIDRPELMFANGRWQGSPLDKRTPHSMVGYYSPDITRVRRVSYSLAGCALDDAPDGGVVHLSVRVGIPFRPTPRTETADPDLRVLAPGAAVVTISVVTVVARAPDE
jgi:hypothetical protein